MISSMYILGLASSVDILHLVILLQLGLGLGLAYYIAIAANFAHTKPSVDELSAAPASNSNSTAAAEYVEGGMEDVDIDDHSTRVSFKLPQQCASFLSPWEAYYYHLCLLICYV
jgi:hypothetical protein